MNYISVCAGIEAFSEAVKEMDYHAVAFAEIDRAASSVLLHHYPDVPNVGDFTAIRGDEYDAVDLLVGGTPCQDFSVAGLRKGLGGERGGLTIEFARLAHRLAARARTRWLLWENVPGVLSIDDGRAFAIFLSAMCGRAVQVPKDGWQNSGIVEGTPQTFGLAYRVLDAQYAGVPQRRRRVFVVGYFGDWRRAAAVLFERHSLSRNSPPSREAWKRITGSLSARTEGGGGLGTDFECAGGGVEATPARLQVPELRGGECSDVVADVRMVRSRTEPICMSTGQASAEIGIGIGTTLNCNHEAPIVTAPLTSKPYADNESQEDKLVVTHALRAEGFDASEDGTGRGTPIIAIQTGSVRENPESGPDGVGVRTDGIAYTLEARAEVQAIAFSSKDHGADAGELSPTLRSMGHDGSHANGGGQIAVAFRASGQEGFTPSDQAPPIAATDGGGAGVPTIAVSANQRGEVRERTVHGSLSASKSAKQFDGVMQGMAVRRLTPEECESLQGFPRGFTKIHAKMADGPRYKMLGNSMAVPVIRWLAQRIKLVEGMA